MSPFRRIPPVRTLVLGLAAVNLALLAGFHPAQGAPGDTAGDCWTVNPVTGLPMNANFVASPNNPIDCALPANTCRTKGNCEVFGLGWARWTDAIRMGDCSKPNKNGNCQICSDRLTCAVGDRYGNSNDCNNQQNKLAGLALNWSTQACK